MGKFTELLKTATKKGLQVEGNQYMDTVDGLELYGEEIVIRHFTFRNRLSRSNKGSFMLFIIKYTC